MDTKLHPIIIRVHDVIGMLHTISAGCSNQFAPAQTSTLSTPASRGQLLLLQVPRPWPAAPNHEVSSLTTSWWPFSCHLPLSRGGHSPATSPSHVVAILLPPPQRYFAGAVAEGVPGELRYHDIVQSGGE